MINPTLAVLIDFKCDIRTRECGKGEEEEESKRGE